MELKDGDCVCDSVLYSGETLVNKRSVCVTYAPDAQHSVIPRAQTSWETMREELDRGYLSLVALANSI